MLTHTQFDTHVLPLFGFLKTAGAEVVGALCEHGVLATLPSGAFICMEGDACSQLAMVLTGRARVYKTSDTGREITLYRITPGQSCILTASCILSTRSFPAFAVTETDVTALVVPAATLHDWVQRHAVWRTYVFDLMAQRLSNVISVVEEVTFGRLDARLAAYLLAETKPDSPVLYMTHEALAAELGSAREVISRLLKDFEHSQTLALARGTVTVLDRAGLAQTVRGT